MKGWLDNYNDSKTSAPEGFQGEGYSMKGRNYSPAWGGQFQMGGDVYPVNYVPQAQNGDRLGEWFNEDAREREPNMMEETYDDYNTAMIGMMKSKMATQAALGNPGARRMMTNMPAKYIFTGEERFSDGTPSGASAGTPGSHYMANRDNYTFPYLQDNGEGTLNFIPNASPSDREAMRFENADEANYFANHYKEVAPMMKHYGKMQMGGSLPGAVGFTYARVGGAPSNGPYAKKTKASAQNGNDVKIINTNKPYSEYSPLTNAIYLKNQEDLPHEKYHYIQNTEGRLRIPSYDDLGIMRKKPSTASTPEEESNYYNRKKVDADIMMNMALSRHPDFNFVPKQILYDKEIQPAMYKTFWTAEGEAENYLKEQNKSFQNGEEMRYYQNGLDWKPKGMRDGGWLDGYEKAQEGTQILNSRQKRGLDLLIKETNNAKKDEQELHSTGTIKHPRSVAYKQKEIKPSEVRKHVPQSTLSKTWEVLTHPMTAAGYAARHEDLPDHFSKGAINAHEQAVDVINPFFYVNEAGEFEKNIREGHPLDAAGNALNFVPALAEFGPELRSIKTSIAPELRQGLHTNGLFSPEYLEGLKRTTTKKLFDSRSANMEENLKRLKLLTSPKTLKAIGNVDAPIADKMLYEFMTDGYPSVKQFRTDVKKAILEANRIKKLNPEFDFSPEIFNHPDLVNHTNDYLLSKPKNLSKFANAKKAAEKTIANKQNVKSFLEKEYVKKMDLINQDPILKKIAEESPQYVDDIYDYLKNPNKSADEFVNDLIKQSNTFTRSMHKSMGSGKITKEDFFTPKGRSMGFTDKNTIDVEGFPTSDMRGEYGKNKYKIFPNEERMADIASTPLEQRWAKRFPNTFAGNENIDFGLGVHSHVENDFLHKAIVQRRLRNNMLVNRGSASIQPEIITSDIIPYKYLYQPKHVVFNTPEQGALVKGFDVEQVSDTWNPFKPSGKFGLEPGYTKGFKEGGVIKDDRGQWDHPGEITEIGSNQITMQGVPYDVLGISDTGDTKLMKPGKNYKFKGKKVTEFPMAKNGLRQEQKGLINLDQLTNFTNYNTKQPGGWLDTL